MDTGNNNEDETIKRPFQAYVGDEPYIFISYAHKDAKIVFPEIKRFNDEGYNVWYDQGLIAGQQWDDEVAKALCASSLVIAFVSKNSIASKNVQDEIRLAIDENINLVPIHLEETQLSPGLKLRLSSKHAILKYSLNYEDYLTDCFKAFENANLPKDKLKSIDNPNNEVELPEEVTLPGCNKKETLIFKDLCNYCLDKSFDVEIDPRAISGMVSKYYDEEDFEKLADKIRYSLKNLEKNNYITSDGSTLGMGFSTSSITFHGFLFYLKNFVEDKAICSKVIRAILVDELSTIDEISSKYNILPSIVEALVKLFRNEDYLVCNNNLTGISATPAGEEYFEEMLNQ